VRFAEDCAVLDILSGGRTEIAVAIGYRRREAEAFGVDFSSRGRRTDEFLEIVRRPWRGERFSYAGKHFTLKDASIAPATPGEAVDMLNDMRAEGTRRALHAAVPAWNRGVEIRSVCGIVRAGGHPGVSLSSRRTDGSTSRTNKPRPAGAASG
jgi:alkanesulfonate monooxygenase SsuD/methylene tetrahydromethanopterin reductase-like flavin-dependent oxidoreductase (luciferase family)